MRKLAKLILVPFVLVASSTVALSHELWIDPDQYQPDSGAELNAALRNGQNFKGISLAWFDRRVDRFDRIQNGAMTPVTGRPGDDPAVQLPDAGNGLMVLAYVSNPSVITYTEWEKFTDFVRHKDLAGTLEAHASRALPETGFREVYIRYSKALIGAGDAAGTDRATGMETELIALANPYTDALDDGFSVQLLYQDAPRADAQIEVFARAPDGTVSITTTRTDAEGIARIAVLPGHEYLLDAVVMREPAAELAAEKDAVWESLWAALTFKVPGQN